MKKIFLTLNYLVLFATSLIAQNEIMNDSVNRAVTISASSVKNSVMLDPWVTETGTQFTMPIYAQVKKNGVIYEPTGLLVGIFKNNKCWGYKNWINGPVGKVHQITAVYNTTPATGFNYKVYDAGTGQYYEVVETVNFASNTPVGAIASPIIINVKFTITASTNNVTKGTVTGTQGSFTSGQSVSLTATPVSTAYRFVNWTEGASVVSTSSTFSFSASENRTLVANFENEPVTLITNTNATTISNPTSTDLIVSSSNGKLNIDASLTLKSLSVDNGGKISLPNTNTLTVNGNFELKSDAINGTSTFVDSNPNGGLTVTGTTTVQQYLTGAGGATPSGRFWYVGTPVSGATSAVFDAAGANQLWYYNEPTHAYVEITDNTTPLVVGRGYVVRLGANTTVTFTGTLVTGTKVLNLTNTSGHAKSGFNLIVNPYPSFVNIDTALSGTVSPSVWTRSENSGNEMVFDTYNTSLNIGTSASGKTVTPYIAPLQAYWVKLSVGTTGSISLTNSLRTLQDEDLTTNKLKAPQQANISLQFLRLRVSNGINSDETVIAFNPSALNGFDNYDSPKMSNDNVAIPEIYTISEGEKVAINGMNTIALDQQMALGFTTGQSNSFSIKATEVNNLDTDVKIILLDNLLDRQQELTQGAEYNFTSDIATTSSRFSILFKSASGTTGLNNESVEKPVRISNYVKGQITVTLSKLTNKQVIITILNTVGQTLETIHTNGITNTINTQLKSGIYFVNVNVSGVNTTKKLIVE